MISSSGHSSLQQFCKHPDRENQKRPQILKTICRDKFWVHPSSQKISYQRQKIPDMKPNELKFRQQEIYLNTKKNPSDTTNQQSKNINRNSEN